MKPIICKIIVTLITLAALVSTHPIAYLSDEKFSWEKVSDQPVLGINGDIPNKSIILIKDNENQISAFDWQKRKYIWHVALPDASGIFRWSPDQKIIASISNGTIQIFDALTGQHFDELEKSINQTSKPFLGEIGYADLRWRPSSNELTILTDFNILTYSSDSGKLLQRVKLPGFDKLTGSPSPSYFDWSPDGKRLALAQVKTSDSEPVYPLQVVLGIWDKDGKWLNDYDERSSTESCIPASSAVYRGNETFFSFYVAWSPYNTTLAVSMPYSGYQLCTFGDDNSIEVQSIPTSQYAQEISWSPDGRWLANAGNNCLITIADANNNYSLTDTQLDSTDCVFHTFQWSKDSLSLMVGTEDGLWIGKVSNG
ncbi:MAG: PD40 domain-containing protein [Anaerolineae bacterium]|nr:PD40 domain-containing protein [Anaerolineae bacterium]